MSVLRSTDQDLHYFDGSHRWTCPDPDGDQDAWTDRVRAHVEEHTHPRADTPSHLLAPRRRSRN